MEDAGMQTNDLDVEQVPDISIQQGTNRLGYSCDVSPLYVEPNKMPYIGDFEQESTIFLSQH